MKFSRYWAMPSPDTFSVPVIGDFVRSYLAGSRVSVDPFARNSRLATYRNDLNPDTAAESHLDAEEFCRTMAARGLLVDLAIFDPPYSPGQIKEVYQGIGREVTTETTQNGALYRRVRGKQRATFHMNQNKTLIGPAGRLADLFGRTLEESARVKLLLTGTPGIGLTDSLEVEFRIALNRKVVAETGMTS